MCYGKQPGQFFCISDRRREMSSGNGGSQRPNDGSSAPRQKLKFVVQDCVHNCLVEGMMGKLQVAWWSDSDADYFNMRDVSRDQANGDAVSGPVDDSMPRRASDAVQDSNCCNSGQILRNAEHEDSFLIETQQMERRRQIMEWTRDDVTKWLETRQLSRYSRRFWEHCIDGSILLELDERDLFEDLFIDNSESRLAIMQNIACLQFYVMYGHEYPLANRST